MNTATATVTDAVALPVALESSQHQLAHGGGGSALVLDNEKMKNLISLAEMMSTAVATVPKHLQKNKGDCLAICIQATLWNMSPFAVAQKTHTVNGTLGYEAQLVNAVVASLAPTKDRINYEWFGNWAQVMGKFKEGVSKTKKDEDTGEFKKYRVPNWTLEDEAGLGIRVWATMKGESEPRLLELLLVQARTRNSPLWAEDPRQQLAYLAVKRWTRLHCPDVLLGVYTPDELQEFAPPKDMGPADVVTPKVPEDLLNAAQAAADKGRAAFAQWWKDGATPPERALLQHVLADLQERTTAAEAKRTVDNGDKGTPEQDKTAGAATPAATSTVTAKTADPAAPTAAGIEEKLNKAKTLAALDIAADWIKELSDATERAKLDNLYDKRHAELSPK